MLRKANSTISCLVHFLWFIIVLWAGLSGYPLLLHFVHLLTRAMHSVNTLGATYISFKTYVVLFYELFLTMGAVFLAARSDIIYLRWQREQLSLVFRSTRTCIPSYIIEEWMVAEVTWDIQVDLFQPGVSNMPRNAHTVASRIKLRIKP